MAVRKGKNFSGLVGNTVLRDDNGKQILQLAPVHVRQTEETKKSATQFGRASRIANIMRTRLHYSYKHYDRGMVNRFNKVMNSILSDCFDKNTEIYTFAPNSFERLVGLEFNDKSRLVDNLLVKVTGKIEENKLIITIPDIAVTAQLKFPIRATHCKPVISICLFSPETSLHKKKVIDLDLIKKVKEIRPAQELTVEAPEGTLCVVAVGLKYYSIYNDVQTPVIDKTFDPAGVCIALVNAGTFSVDSVATEIKIWEKNWELKMGEVIFTTSITNEVNGQDLLNLDQTISAADAMSVLETAHEQDIVTAAYNKALDVARNLKTMGLADADIAKATGLTMEQITGS